MNILEKYAIKLSNISLSGINKIQQLNNSSIRIMSSNGTPAKKPMLDETVNQDDITDFSKFELKRILSNNTKTKVCFVQGTFNKKETPAIIVLEKKAFSEDSLKDSAGGFLSGKSTLTKTFTNDVYGNYECKTKTDCNGLKTVIIYPATEQQIRKFEDQEVYIIQETPDIYKRLVLPYMLKEKLSVQWVYNILDDGKEAERILVKDDCPENGFVAIPDLKWDGNDISSLYYLAIIRKKGVKSIRDLNSSYIPMLKNVRDKVLAAIKEKHGYAKEQIKVFFHYHPTFLHLHIHFVYAKYDAPGTSCDRAHLLETVINNMEMMDDYYEKATLSVMVLEKENLFTILKNEGVLKLQDKE